MNEIITAVSAAIAFVGVLIGVRLERRHSVLSERRQQIVTLDVLSVEMMEFAHAVSLMRDQANRSLYSDAPQDAIDYRIKAFAKNYNVRQSASLLNINCNVLDRKRGSVLLANVWVLEDCLMNMCDAMLEVNVLARSFPRGLPYIDPFHSKEVLLKLNKLDEKVNAVEEARKALMGLAKSQHRPPAFMRPDENPA